MSAGSALQPRLGRSLTGGRSTRAAGWVIPGMVAALTVLAAVLRFYGLGHQGFWYDEANTAQLVRFSPGKMLGLIPQSESTPPLYYCIAWVWVRVFGDTEAGLRSLSAVAGVLTVPVAYGAAARLFAGGPRAGRGAPGPAARAAPGPAAAAGVIAAALTACSPLLIWYSQEARSYALLVLLTGLSLLAFSSARVHPSRRRLALWVVASVLALATHYYAVVAVVPQAVWLLVEHRRERAVLVAVGIVGLCGLALIPLAISQNGTGNDRWIAHSDFGVRLRQIIPQFLIGTNAPHRLVVKYVAMGCGVVGLGLLAFAADAEERRPALLAGALALAGFAISLVLKLVGFDDLITRNILPLWLPAALLLTGGLAARRTRRLGAVVTVVLCAAGVYATVGIATTRAMQRPDWRYVARALGTGRPAGPGRAILVQHYAYLLPLSLYLPGLKDVPPGDRRRVRVREIDVISMVSPQQPLCWWGAACNLIPSRMQRRYDIPGFRVAARRHVLQWTILTMVARRPVLLDRREVAAALHTTSLRHDELIYQPG